MSDITKTIYIDVLIGTNIIINYFILAAVEKITKIQPKTFRTVLGSCFGAACSLIILLPDIGFIPNLLLKLSISACIILITCGFHSLASFAKNLGLFYLISFAFAGIMLFVWFMLTPKGMTVKNSVVYFNISPVIMVVTTVACYFIIRLINRFTNKDKGNIEICKIKIINNDNYCQFYGKIDTGNTLCEPFSQYLVIVASEDAVKPVAEEAFSNLLTYSEPDRVLKHKYRLVPYTSIGGSGLLPAFLPKEVYINDNYCPQKVYIAVCKSNVLKGEIKAMVNPEIIEYVKDDYCDIGKIV